MVNPASRRGRGFAACASSAVASLKLRARFQLHRPAKAGDERRVVWPDIGAPGAVALLQAQRLDGAIACIGDAVLLACRHQRVINGQRKLDRDMQFPAELADIGDAERKHRRAGDGDALHPGEGKARVRHVVLGQLLEHVARLGAHHREDGIGRGDIDQPGIEPVGNRARDPVEIVRGEASAGDDVIFVRRQPADREIAFDAAAICSASACTQDAPEASRRRWRRSTTAPFPRRGL